MRKLLFFVLGVVFFGLVGWLVYSSVRTLEHKELRKSKVAALPPLVFKDLRGDEIQLKLLGKNKPTVLILFNSECEHCQYEAKSIAASKDHFKDYQLVFVSEEPIATIVQFSSMYGLANLNNVIFGRTNIADLIDLFKSISYPNIFIYGSDGKLLKEYKGEVKVETMLSVLRSAKD